MWEDELAYIGMRAVWGGRQPFGLSPAIRGQHLFVIGQTGTGKSTLLRNLIIQDIERGYGVGLIDPHGDLAEEIIDTIPSYRTDDVVYFHPADIEYPVGLNVLSANLDLSPHLLTSGIVSAMRSIWRDSWGPRTEYILYATLAALGECENVSLLAVQRMLVDPLYRKWVLRQVRDPIVTAFWEGEFAGYDRRFLAEVIAPVQNKVGQLVMSPPIRHILGQIKSKMNVRFMMDRKRILIANLSKGKIGDSSANLLGSLLLTQCQLAALSRANIPQERRVPFNLYVDEFHNFVTDSFASMLSESRKYQLSLTLASQYTSQTRVEIRDAIFGNVGTIISFRLGEADARVLASEFGNDLRSNAFTGLSNREIMVKLLTKDGYREPFRAQTLAPLRIRSGRRDYVINRSRERYAVKREAIEDKINRWIGKPSMKIAKRKHNVS